MPRDGTSGGVIRFGVFEMDLAARELRKGGVKIKIQEQPFLLLRTLVERPGQVVTREELKDRLWSEDTFVEFDHSLNTAVQKIRQALNDSATGPRFLETLPRVGYRFVAPVDGRIGRAAAGARSFAAPMNCGENSKPNAASDSFM